LEVPKAGKLTVWTEGKSDTGILLCYNPYSEDSLKRTLIGLNDDISNRDKNARVSENVRAERILGTIPSHIP